MDASLISVPLASQAPDHFSIVKSKIPEWLIKAPSTTHSALRQAGGQPPDWLADARESMPGVLKALQQEYSSFRHWEQQLKPVLVDLPALEAFAEPLLVAAIKNRFGLQVDVRKTWLFHGSRVQVDDSFAGMSKDPLVELQKALKAATQTLLHAALQNFESWETTPGAMDWSGGTKAAIYDRYPVSVVTVTGTPLAITPHDFAALCRELDLGGQYQKKIKAFLYPPSPPGDGADAATFNRQGLLKRVEQSASNVQVHLAYLRGDIDASMYNALLEVGRNLTTVRLDGQPVTCGFLRLWDIELTGIVALGKSRDKARGVEKVVVYIPDDPVCPLKEYESSAAFTRALRDRLLQDGYLGFFQRFIPGRHRAELLAKLDECLRPKVWNSQQRWYEQQVDRNARLHLRERSLDIGLLTAIVEQKNAVLKDDALFHAVPTAEEDQKTQAERLHYFESLAMQALNVVGFFVPPVGAVMMAVAAAQLSVEVFEGIDSWTRAEWDQGWGYLMDVLENLALMATLGAAHQGGTPALEKMTVETPSFIEELKEVEMPDGQTRLWKPDLAPFAHDTVLPAGLKPDEFGVYHYQNKTWVSIEDHVYSVKQTASSGLFRIEHPTRALNYEPPLRNNGAGGWLHPVDQPREWQGLKLFRRLGHATDGFSDVTARRILQVSDTHEAVLRRVLAENQRPPALLDDTMRRFELDQQIHADAQTAAAESGRVGLFEARYRAMSASQQAEAAPIMRDYPGLPATIADELVRNASVAELELLAKGRVPLRIAEEIRVYQQQVRLARAYEGVYLESVNNPDTDMLILHSLERFAGWPSGLRLEVREGGFSGALLDAVGPAEADVRKVLARYANGYEAFDAQGLELHGRDDLYSSVLHALPDTQRAALGFPGTWEGPKLKIAVQNGPLLPRPTLRTLLKMQPTRPGPKSPMRLADSRPGYPLSGRGALPGFVARDTLLDLIAMIDVSRADRSPEQILTALEVAGMDRQQIHQRLVQVLDERNALDVSMSAWGQASASIVNLDARLPSRNAIHDAIWLHWAETALPEVATGPSALRLQNVVLSDFPEVLPEFFHQRVSHLELIDISVSRTPVIFSPAVDYRGALAQFFGRFSGVTSLEMNNAGDLALRREALAFQLPELIARCFPRLRVLRLLNQPLWLSELDVQSLGALEHLEWLDLSGNRVSSMMSTWSLAGLRLRYLGLDNVGLDSWPRWLDDLPSANIAEVSLRDNNIAELPRPILDSGTTGRQPTDIWLQGNPLSRLTQIRIQLDEAPDSRFRFNLDVSAVLDTHVAVLRQERSQLQDAIASWAEASSSSKPLGEASIAARRAIGQTLLDFWRAYSEGQTLNVLTLEHISLADFPRQLPAFFCTRIRSLRLEGVTGDTAQLNTFLSSFPQLDRLELLGQAQPMPELPPALLSLPRLTNLSLRNQGRVLDQQAISFLARLPHIEILDLSGNQLGAITDTSGFSTKLRWLSLDRTGLDSWPDWVDTLLPLEGLMLEDNLITDLPEHILDNPRNDNAHTEIALRGNPLSFETMSRAHVSENYRSAYSFVMDLPPEIEAMPRERHYSGSDSDGDLSDSESSGGLYAAGAASPAEVALVEPWLLASVDENELHRALWQRLEAAQDASDLMALIGRLTQAAPYRSQSTRVDFAERVWRVLQAADQNPESRLLYNGLAQEALVQPETGAQTCHDGAWLVFNQIEIQMFIAQPVSDAPAALRGQSLYRLTRRLYRLHELDSIAREQAAGRDEAEVRLAYRLRWSTELDLPLPPGSMLYQVHANIRPGELDSALARVQQGEHGEPFMAYAAQRDFWVQYLRETYAERFEVLKQDYLARVAAVPDRFPERALDELGEEFAALKQAFEAQETSLIRELTNREGGDQA
jgi:Leucine-rich repeat (LRR) protein